MQKLIFEECIEKITTPPKLPKKEYMKEGKYPIVAQELELINGYTNKEKFVFEVVSPIIIFGDHTRIVKYVDFNFVMGADGAKIIKPKKNINPKFFYYYLKLLMPKSSGYARHYKLLKKLTFDIPSLTEQQHAVAKLDVAFAEIDRAIATSKLKQEEVLFLKKTALTNKLDFHDERVKLGEIATFVRGLTYSKKDEVEHSKKAVLRATNINLASHRLVFDEIRYIKEDVIIKENKFAKEGDILMCTASGSKSHLGKVALVKKDTGMAFGGFMATLRCNENCKPSYLYFVLTSAKFFKHLDTISEGTNINNLKFSQIENFEFPLPTIEEQEHIVAKLNAEFNEIKTVSDITKKQLINYQTLKSVLLKQEIRSETT